MRQVGEKVIVDDGVLPKWVMISACACEVKIHMCLRLSGSLQEERMC